MQSEKSERSSIRPIRLMTLGLLVLLSSVVGCGGQNTAAAVNPTKARDTLKIVLDGWKAGKKVDDFKADSPSVVVQDFDWMGGAQLLSYEVTGEGKDDNANLRIPVKLVLKTPKGEVKKSVSYVVGTDPVLTVFRDFN